ncbi:hypothetical protein PTKIN_Ptkin03bG0142000 [Pterospermum kingtungense]
MVTSALEPEIIEDVGISPAPEGEDFALPPESDDDFDEDEVATPPARSPEQLKFLNACLSKITEECAKQVFTYMFEDLTVTDKCCGVLIEMGEPCHISLVKTIFSMPEYKANASLGIPRSKQVWNKCALVVAPTASSPIPSEN